MDLPNSAVRYNSESVSKNKLEPSQEVKGASLLSCTCIVVIIIHCSVSQNGGHMPSPPSPHGSSSSLVSADGASPDGGHVTSAPSSHRSDGEACLAGEEEKEVFLLNSQLS